MWIWIKRNQRMLYFSGLAALVVAAHIRLLTSDDVPFETALRLTTTNAAIWAVLIVPALFFWWNARLVRRRQGED